MVIGIPKGLLYWKYNVFIKSFFKELGCEVITSNDTNKEILNLGVNCTVDETCVPIKVFHGHVVSIKNKCDKVFIPRIMRLSEREYICPKFCGLPEMVKNSIPNIDYITGPPIYAENYKNLRKYMIPLGYKISKNRKKINKSFENALLKQQHYCVGNNDEDYSLKIALIGHPYNIQDKFMNMNIIKKLNKLKVGAVTEEFASENEINKFSKQLFKRPFWTFARKSYGASMYFAQNNKVDGIIYISSFACGIDSVVIELIKDGLNDFPFLVLKVDEQTGEGGFNTRIEAFVDMIERRKEYESNISSSRQCIYSH